MAQLTRSAAPLRAVPLAPAAAPPTIFSVLYTHQLTKKVKTWRDGIATLRGRRLTLFEASATGKAGRELGSMDVPLGVEVAAGDELDGFEGFLVQIEGIVGAAPPAPADDALGSDAPTKKRRVGLTAPPRKAAPENIAPAPGQWALPPAQQQRALLPEAQLRSAAAAAAAAAEAEAAAEAAAPRTAPPCSHPSGTRGSSPTLTGN